jgi:hypothetical protein
MALAAKGDQIIHFVGPASVQPHHVIYLKERRQQVLALAAFPVLPRRHKLFATLGNRAFNFANRILINVDNIHWGKPRLDATKDY